MSVVGCGRQWAMVACIFTGWSSCTRFFVLKVPWDSFRASKIADINFGMYLYSFFTLTGVTSHFFDCFRYLRWYLWSPLVVVAISRSTCALWSSTARCTLARYAWSLHFNKIIAYKVITYWYAVLFGAYPKSRLWKDSSIPVCLQYIKTMPVQLYFMSFYVPKLDISIEWFDPCLISYYFPKNFECWLMPIEVANFWPITICRRTSQMLMLTLS